MLYGIAVVFGFVLAMVLISRKDTLTDSIQVELKKGKKVLLATNTSGVLMELVDGNLVHTPVLLDFDLFATGGNTDDTVTTVDDLSRH